MKKKIIILLFFSFLVTCTKKPVYSTLNTHTTSVALDSLNNQLNSLKVEFTNWLFQANTVILPNIQNLITTQIPELSAQIDSLTQERIPYLAKVDSLSTQLTLLQTQLNNVSGAEVTNASFTTLQNTVSVLNTGLSSVQADLSAVTSQVQGLNLTPINTQLATLTSSFNTLSTKVTTNQNLNSTQIVTLQNQIAAINTSTIANLQATITQNTTDITTLLAQGTSLQSQITTTQTEILSLQSNLTALQTSNTSLQNQINTLTTQNASLQTILSSLQAQNVSLQAQYDSIINVIQANIASLNTTVNAMSMVQTSIQNQVTQIQATVNTLNNRIVIIGASFTELSSRTNTITAKFIKTSPNYNLNITLKNYQDLSGNNKTVQLIVAWGGQQLYLETDKVLSSGNITISFPIPISSYSQISKNIMEIAIQEANQPEETRLMPFTINPYAIYDVDDFHAIDDIFSNTLPTCLQTNMTLTLMQDIDVGTIIEPLMNDYTGSIDGNYKRMYNITLPTNTPAFQALLGGGGTPSSCQSQFVSIKNLQIEYSKLILDDANQGCSAIIRNYAGDMKNINLIIDDLEVINPASNFAALFHYPGYFYTGSLTNIYVRVNYTLNNQANNTLSMTNFSTDANTMMNNIVFVSTNPTPTIDVRIGTSGGTELRDVPISSTFSSIYYFKAYNPNNQTGGSSANVIKIPSAATPLTFYTNLTAGNWILGADGFPRIKGFSGPSN